jgi:predicted kinase
MTSVVIVTGSPGSGKTTIGRALAAESPQGLHLVSDTYYEFIAHRLDPTQPESQHQNTVVMHALASSVRAFADGGYRVYLDGVIGPWFLALFQPYLERLSSVQYVVLQVPESDALMRVRSREGRGLSPHVTQMHGALSNLGPLAKHAVDVGGMGESESLEKVRSALASGLLELDWSLVVAP